MPSMSQDAVASSSRSIKDGTAAGGFLSKASSSLRRSPSKRHASRASNPLPSLDKVFYETQKAPPSESLTSPPNRPDAYRTHTAPLEILTSTPASNQASASQPAIEGTMVTVPFANNYKKESPVVPGRGAVAVPQNGEHVHVASTAAAAQLLPPTPSMSSGQVPNLLYQHIHDMASKRISTLDYFRKAYARPLSPIFTEILPLSDSVAVTKVVCSGLTQSTSPVKIYRDFTTSHPQSSRDVQPTICFLVSPSRQSLTSIHKKTPRHQQQRMPQQHTTFSKLSTPCSANSRHTNKIILQTAAQLRLSAEPASPTCSSEPHKRQPAEPDDPPLIHPVQKSACLSSKLPPHIHLIHNTTITEANPAPAPLSITTTTRPATLTLPTQTPP